MATDNFFNVEDAPLGIFRQLAEGISTQVFPGDQAMLSLVRCEPNTAGRIHSHPEEQWGICLEGSGVRIQDGKDVPFKKGDFWRTPGGVEHGVRAGEDGAMVMDIFAPPREEYKKSGSGFGA